MWLSITRERTDNCPTNKLLPLELHEVKQMKDSDPHHMVSSRVSETTGQLMNGFAKMRSDKTDVDKSEDRKLRTLSVLLYQLVAFQATGRQLSFHDANQRNIKLPNCCSIIDISSSDYPFTQKIWP